MNFLCSALSFAFALVAIAVMSQSYLLFSTSTSCLLPCLFLFILYESDDDLDVIQDIIISAYGSEMKHPIAGVPRNEVPIK